MNRRLAFGVAVAAVVAGAVISVVLWGRGSSGFPDDCDSVGDPDARNACHTAAVLRDAEAGRDLRAAIDSAPDAETRDLLRLRLVMSQPARARSICPNMEGEQARTWCESLEGRSHLLHRGKPEGN